MGKLPTGEREAEAYFARIKWPNGFRCPRCSHGHAYAIRSRRLVLYQCARCRRQTTVTSGTVMDKSRTPLRKWAMAMQLLSTMDGVNAVQLAAHIRVTYKTAWTMLHKIRQAISQAESQNRLAGHVFAGVGYYGGFNLHPNVLHPHEHAIMIAQGSTETYRRVIKLIRIPPNYLEKKRVTRQGEHFFRTNYVRGDAVYGGLIGRYKLREYPLLFIHFKQAKGWINKMFHGIGAKYQQLYWDEYCFRWNTMTHCRSVLQELAMICARFLREPAEVAA